MTLRPLRTDVEVHELDEQGETALYDRKGSRLVVLNAVGAGVWHLSDGTRTIDEIVDDIVAVLPADRGRVTADVEAFLRELQANGLVVLR